MERFTIHRVLVRSTLKKIRIKEFADRKLVIQEVFSMPKNTLIRSGRRKKKKDKLQFLDFIIIYVYMLAAGLQAKGIHCYFDIKPAWRGFANMDVCNHAHFLF